MEYSGHTWCTLGILSVQYKCIVYSGHTWSTVGIHGVQWAYMEYSGHTWSTLGIHGVQWAYMDYSGHTWSTVGIHGVQWAYMEHSVCTVGIHGVQLAYMEYSEYLMFRQLLVSFLHSILLQSFLWQLTFLALDFVLSQSFVKCLVSLFLTPACELISSYTIPIFGFSVWLRYSHYIYFPKIFLYLSTNSVKVDFNLRTCVMMTNWQIMYPFLLHNVEFDMKGPPPISESHLSELCEYENTLNSLRHNYSNK